MLLGAVIAYLVSGHRGIYHTQRIDSPKYSSRLVLPDESLRAFAEHRRARK